MIEKYQKIFKSYNGSYFKIIIIIIDAKLFHLYDGNLIPIFF
jgi:hypothetical protein